MKRKVKFIIIVFIILSSIYMIDTTKSRYLSEVSMKNDLNVAIPQIELDTTSTQMNTTMIPGESKSVEFYVKNYKDTQINEVQMEYYININVTLQNIPLTYKIYEISNTTETELTKTTDGYGPITLNYGTSENKYFKVVFTWDASDNSVTYAEQQFKFNIGINATQVI